MKKYAVVGTGVRARAMFVNPLLNDYKDDGRVVGVCDVNPLRMEAFKRDTGLDCPSFTDFDTMLRETKPDAVIVATVDRFHHEYIIKALNAGLDAISEKPMTIDAEKCAAILHAEQKSRGKVIVTFNLRFVPGLAAVKEIISTGVLGRIMSVNCDYRISSPHGAEYFRRWHRKKENSGGLLVHKATHHFDVINWWIDDEPKQVSAFGSRLFFGPGGEKSSKRCLDCPHKADCRFFYDLASDPLRRQLYLESESVDGYMRDACPFSPGTDMEDTMQVSVRYKGGAILGYSLTAYNPETAVKISIKGSEGSLEIENLTGPVTVKLQNGVKQEYTIPPASGAHMGGDNKLRRMLFKGDLPDTLGQMADSRAGAMSLLIGAAANTSIAEENRPVSIEDLLK